MTERFLFLVFTILAVFTVKAFATQLAIRTVYSSTNVGTSSWVEIVSATPYTVNQITVFDSSGQTMQLGVGPAGHETQVAIIPPGGDTITVGISSGSRVSLRSLSATATTGENDLNFEY